MTGKDGKIVKNRGDLMNRSAVSLDVLQDLDPFPWSKWHQVQIGLCHSMRFLIPFCLSLLSTYLTALLSTSEAREMCQIFGSPDLLRLSSRHYCGGPSHAVSQLPEECSRRKHHLNSFQRFRAQLTHWVSDIQTHLINETSKGSNFDSWWEYSRSIQQHRSWSTLA